MTCLSQTFRKVFLIAGMLYSLTGAAQTNFYVGGTNATANKIHIEPGALLYVSGDYIDESDLSDDGDSIDSKLILSGKLILGGDLRNEGTVTSVISFLPPTEEPDTLPDNYHPKVIFNGSVDQKISGNPVFIPGMEVDKSSGNLMLATKISLYDTINLKNGSINLDGNRIELLSSQYAGATIVGENNTNYIYGDGSIYVDAISIEEEGAVEPAGLGLHFTISGAAGLDVSLTRVHETASNLGATRISRYYELLASNENQVDKTLTNLKVEYLLDQINSVNSSNYAIYTSNDDGDPDYKWVPNNASQSGGATLYTATSPSGSMTLGAANRITVGNRVCDNAMRPTFNLTATVHASNSPYDGDIFTGISNVMDNVCEKSEVVLSASDISHATYQWTKGSFILSDTYTYDQLTSIHRDSSGIYQLFVRGYNGCEQTKNIQINVRSNPTPSFTMSPDNVAGRICVPHPIEFDGTGATTDDGSSINTWQWDFGDGNTQETSVGATTHTYTSEQVNYPKLDVITEYGCSSLAAHEDTLTILDPPSIGSITFLNDTLSSVNQECEGHPVTFDPAVTYVDSTFAPTRGTDHAPKLQHTWSFGDGNSFINGPEDYDEVSHTYTYPSDNDNLFPVTLNVLDTKGYSCADTLTRNLVIHPNPRVAFDVLDDGDPINHEVCEGIYLQFLNGSEIPVALTSPSTIADYDWHYRGEELDSTRTEQDPVFQYLEEGNYEVRMTATSTEGCVDSALYAITVHPAPKGSDIYAENPVICTAEEVSFVNGTTIPSPGTVNYTWNFGDGDSSTDEEPVHAYTNAGSFPVTLTRTSDNNCSNTFDLGLIKVKAFPTAIFEASNVCDGNAVNFINKSYKPHPDSIAYSWDFGDGSSDMSADPVHSYTISSFGTKPDSSFNTQLIVTSYPGTAACKDTTTQAVTVYRRPAFDPGPAILTFSPDTTIVPADDPEAFLPAGTSFQWSRSGILVGTSENYTITRDGSYSVLMTTPAPANCQATVSFPAYLPEPVDLGGDQFVCEGGSLDASPEVAGTLTPTYRWYRNGVEISGTQDQPSIVVSEPDLYWVEITYSVLGVSGTTSDEATVDVSSSITVDLPDNYSACEGEEITLDAGLIADTYTWNGPDGPVTPTGQTITVKEPGIYVVAVESGACSDSDQTEVKFNEAPAAAFLTSTSSVCLGESIAFTAFEAVGDVTWDFGDGTGDSGTSVSKQFTDAGTYPVTMDVTSEEGCIGTYTQSVTVHEYPSAGFTFSDVCFGEAMSFTNTSTGPAGVSSYLWDFGDGYTATSANPTHSFPAPGSYLVTLTLQVNGCESSVSQQVSVNEAPSIGFGGAIVTCGSSYLLSAPLSASYRWFDPASGSTLGTDQDYLVTADQAVGLEITTADGCLAYDTTTVSLNTPVVVDLGEDREMCGSGMLDAGFFSGGTYSWSTGEDTRSITVTESGFYQVEVTDQNECEAVSSVFITVSDVPEVNLGSNREICFGEAVTLNAGAGPNAYSWSTGATTQTITVSESGTYSVTVTDGNCTATDEVEVAVRDLPVPDFAWQNVCMGDAILFENNTTGYGSLTYEWSFGDGSISPVSEPSHQYSAPGTYSVSLSVTDERGCSYDTSQLVQVYTEPQVNFTIANQCVGETITFTNRTTIAGEDPLSYTWYFGDGSSSATTQNATHVYSSPGIYYVQLVAESADGCISSTIKQLEVKAAPNVNFGDLIMTCEDHYVLDAGNHGSSYLWSDNSTEQTFLVEESGVYEVTVTNTSECEVTKSVTVELLDSPSPDLGEDQEVCGGVELFANATGNYLWSTGDRDESIEVSETDDYWVLMVSDDLCESSDTVAVVVHANPQFDLGDDLEACDAQQLTIGTDSSGTYNWSTGAATSHITVTESGIYHLSVTSPFGCSGEDSVAVIFHPQPVIPLERNYQTCDQLVLDAGADGLTYTWSTGDTSQYLEVSESGYFWTRVISDKSCEAMDTTFVTIFESPEVDLGADQELCYGETAELDAGSGNSGYSLEWNTGDTGQTITAGLGGFYGVKVTTPDGCVAEDEVAVTIRSPLAPDLGDDVNFCEGSGFQLSSGINDPDLVYAWNSTTGQTGSEPTITPERPGTYWVTVSDTFGCIGADTIRLIETTEQLVASFLVPSRVSQGDYVRFIPLTDPAPESWFWEFGDGGTSSSESPTYQYFSRGTYQVTLTVSNGVCSHSLTKTIEVRPAGERTILPDEDADFRFIEITAMDVYPNPAKEEMMLDLTLNQESTVLVTIHDIKGLQVFAHEYQDIFESTLDFDLTGLRDGMYLISVQVGLERKISRFLKIK